MLVVDYGFRDGVFVEIAFCAVYTENLERAFAFGEFVNRGAVNGVPRVDNAQRKPDPEKQGRMPAKTQVVGNARFLSSLPHGHLFLRL